MITNKLYLIFLILIGASCSDNAPTPVITKNATDMSVKQQNHPMITKSSDKVSPPKAKSIKPTINGDIATIYSNRLTLKNKTILVSGKVMKFSPRIMGKNWVHLQDGSGDPTKNTNDLTVTTQSDVKVGDIVTFKGLVEVDQKLGMGTVYPIILQKAVLIK